MRKSRFSEEQIIGILKEGEGGANIGELCRRRDMLIARVKIAAYNQHCSAPFFRALVVLSATKFTREKEPTTPSNQPAMCVS